MQPPLKTVVFAWRGLCFNKYWYYAVPAKHGKAYIAEYNKHSPISNEHLKYYYS
jgi:hypothetical protein